MNIRTFKKFIKTYWRPSRKIKIEYRTGYWRCTLQLPLHFAFTSEADNMGSSNTGPLGGRVCFSARVHAR
jgi:hypothetical protein